MFQNPTVHALERQRHRYADCSVRILRIADEYPNMDYMDYPQHLAHNLSLLNILQKQPLSAVLEKRYS